MVDRVCPTGTAIQLLRQEIAEPLTRDGYHLSYGLGRYTAAMAFLKALTGCELEKLRWMPEGVSDAQRRQAIRAVNRAMENPYNE